MRGMEYIVSARRAGFKPDHVTLGLPGIGLSSGALMAGQVLLDDGDRHESTDLRPLYGVRVVVMALAGNYEAAEAWARAVCKAEARHVGIAFHSRDAGLDGPVWIRVNGEQWA